jgi:hypothetical protein
VGSSPLSRTLTVGNIRLLRKTRKQHGQPTVSDKQEKNRGKRKVYDRNILFCRGNRKCSVFKKDNSPILTKRGVITCVSGVDKHLGFLWGLHDREKPVIIRNLARRSHNRVRRILSLVRRKEFLLQEPTKCLNYLTNKTKSIKKSLML